jgi:hypothetical protein
MKRAALFAVLAFAVAAILVVAPAFAGGPNGQTVSETDHVHGVFDEPEATNPCTNDAMVAPDGGAGVQFTGNLVNHVTYFTASDEVWATFTETGAIQGTDAGTGVTYTGHATAWGNFNMNERNQNSTFTLTIHAVGSDGSSFDGHETTAFVLNADGRVTVDFDKMKLTCSA